MKNYGRDRAYWRSVLGILEILIMVKIFVRSFPIESSSFVLCFLICLFCGMVCALIASTGWAQQADWVSEICQSYQTNVYVAALVECSANASPDAYRSLSANTVKTAVIAIFVLSLVIVLIIFLIHIFLAFRRRKYWRIITRIIAVIFILLFLMVLSISIAAIFWEVKLSTIFGSRYTSNSFQSTPNGYRKAQTGAAGAAAAFGFLAAIFLLIDVIYRLLAMGSLRKRSRRGQTRINVIS